MVITSRSTTREFCNGWSQVAVAIKNPSLLIVGLRYDDNYFDNLEQFLGNLIQFQQQFSFFFKFMEFRSL